MPLSENHSPIPSPDPGAWPTCERRCPEPRPRVPVLRRRTRSCSTSTDPSSDTQVRHATPAGAGARHWRMQSSPRASPRDWICGIAVTPSREAARSHSCGRRRGDGGCGTGPLARYRQRVVARLRLVAEAIAGETPRNPWKRSSARTTASARNGAAPAVEGPLLDHAFCSSAGVVTARGEPTARCPTSSSAVSDLKTRARQLAHHPGNAAVRARGMTADCVESANPVHGSNARNVARAKARLWHRLKRKGVIRASDPRRVLFADGSHLRAGR
jgi:hypothetical protein